jgi:uncharacterized surface protein with fasciclin (FAS1) repeats
MSLFRLTPVVAAVALVGTAAAAQAPTQPAATSPAAPAAKPVTPAGDLIATARAAGQFNTFLKAAEATNLIGVLSSNRNLTVFAPTDAAFAALPAGELDRLMVPENRQQLQQLLTYHIVNAPLESSRIKGRKGPVATVAGANLVLDGSGASLMANNATIVQADVRASNGILHVVDKVLSPTTAAATAPTAAATGTASNASASKAGERPAAKGN